MVKQGFEETIWEESTGWDRPKFETLLHRVIDLHREGKVDAIVFPRTDRLARLGDAFGYYLGLLRKEGLEAHFARERMKATGDALQTLLLNAYGHRYSAPFGPRGSS